MRFPNQVWLITPIIFTATVFPATGQPQVTLDTIAKAWQERQDRFRTVQITWEEDHVMTQGGISRGLPPNDPGLGVTGPVPPSDHSFKVTHSLVIEGDRYRYSSQGEIYDAPDRAFVSYDRLAVYDGKVQSTKIKSGNQSHSRGSVQPQNRGSDMDLTEIYPIAMVVRPVHEKFRSLDIQEFSLTGGSLLIEKRPCPELVRRMPADRAIRSIWIDPSCDYAVTCDRFQADGKLRSNIDVVFKKDPGAGWIPSTWRVTGYNPSGEVRESYDARLTRCEVNQPLPTRMFDLDFDPKTRVDDHKNNEKYIIKDDGSKRPIAKEENTATFDQLHDTEATGSGKKAWTWRPLVVGAALIGLFAAVLGIIYRLRTGRQQHAGAPGAT